jgi:hypothetical protein
VDYGRRSIWSKVSTLNSYFVSGLRKRYRFIHGATIKFPPPNAQDLKDVKRYSKFKHYAPFYGKHWWDPWHQWDNPPAGMEEKYWRAKKRWTTARYWTFWFDIRRVHACACAVSAFGLHIGLMCE